MIAGIILASGFSKRMKREKLLLPFNHEPMILHIVRAVNESEVDESILVFRKERIRQLAAQYVTRSIFNTSAHIGQSAAVRLGLGSVSSEIEACLFIMGDQPLIRSSIINQIILRWKKEPQKIIVPLYNQQPGSPVLFPRSFFSHLMDISGDQGGREVLKRYPNDLIYEPIDNAEAGMDVDTETAYVKLLANKVKK